MSLAMLEITCPTFRVACAALRGVRVKGLSGSGAGDGRRGASDDAASCTRFGRSTSSFAAWARRTGGHSRPPPSHRDVARVREAAVPWVLPPSSRRFNSRLP